jgi:hypothetical protein
MWQLYLYSFLAGIVGVNGVPHFVKGITGEKHHTPFGQHSSAVINVCWGWLNFVVAGLLVYKSHFRVHELRAFGLLALGALIMALTLADSWAKHPDRNK